MRPLESLLKNFVEIHPEDAARAFEALAYSERIRILKSLPINVAVALLERMSLQAASPILGELEPDRLAELLIATSPRVASSLLHQLEESHRESVLSTLPEDSARVLRELALYSADTAGAMMDPRVSSISIDLNAQQAISVIRRAPRESLHYLYVTTRDGRLSGVVSIRDLLLAGPRDPIAPLVSDKVVSIPDTMDQEEVLQVMQDRRFVALPVVDFDGRLIGVVRQVDMLQVGEEEAFEDLQRIVGAGADERALSPVSKVVKSRLPWLLVNLLTAIMAAAVIGLFEDTITQVAALAILLPIVAGQGGNTGSQSLAIVMRGIALREIVSGTKRRVIQKEFVGGLINGVAVAVATSLAVFLWRLAAGDSVSSGVGLSVVIGLAMIVNMTAAAVAGALIPLVLQRLGRDPAQSASIFLTTVTDIVGFAAFLGFATLMMPWITNP